jgi:endonuclease/exonuclease/phosphatase family metal-dependent hydrolase
LYRRSAFIFSLFLCLCAGARAASASPIVWVDTPAQNAGVASSFYISGWTLDFASTSDSGVGQLHAWAIPVSGGDPIFVGVMSAVTRPDVAAAFGARYRQAGFWINGTLPAGSYLIVLTPWSSLTWSFRPEAAVALSLTVRSDNPPPPAPAPSSTTLRVLQWNTHHGGFGTDGTYSPDRIATWAASVNPDVVMFNEIEKNDYWGNEDQPEVYKALLEQKTGRTWYYVFAQEFGDWSANGKGNLILSRFPINVRDRYELVQNADRSIAMGTITVNGRDVTLISTHLDPYDQSLRLAQAREVTGWAAAQPENRIITGDMNAWPDQSSIAHLTSLYNDSWAVAAANGTATAFSGNNGETKNGRIDYIFYSKGSSNLTVKSSQVIDTRDSSGNTPSDHRPVFTVFSVR